MAYTATKPRTYSLYRAIVADNVNRQKELLENIGLSNSDFKKKPINDNDLSRLQRTISMVSQLDQPQSRHEMTLKTFFDFVASAVDKKMFLKSVGEIVSKDETGEKLPEEIRIVLKESDRKSRISKKIEGLSRGQLVTLIRYLTADKKKNLAIIDYERFRAVIRAIQNTDLIQHSQLCCIMLGSLLT